MRAIRSLTIILLAAATGPAPAAAQPTGADALSHERRAIEAFEAGEYRAAAEAFRAQIELDPKNFVPRYNLSNALAASGQTEAALAALERSIELGMSDAARLRTDPALDPLRDRPGFRRILEHWDAIVEAQRAARLERDRTLVGRGVDETALGALRVDVLSAYPERSTELGIEQAQRVAEWAEGVLGLEPAEEGDAWVVVAMPDRGNFRRWAIAALGGGAAGVATVGGAYEHDDRRLVTRDLSATLRHEFFHVLHWRDMERRGQRQPYWIQEGLASLVEDIDAAPGERPAVRLAPSWRTNIVQRNAELNTLKPLAALASSGRRLFTGSRSLAHYAQARETFRFLRDRGELAAWYAAYTTDPDVGFEADPTGVRAIEAVTGLGASAFDTAFEAWVQSQPPVPEDLGELARERGLAPGFEVSPGSGEGPRVVRVTPGVRRSSGLRPGDVLLTVDGMPVGEPQELARRLASSRAGASIAIGYRRGRLYGVAEVVMGAR